MNYLIHRDRGGKYVDKHMGPSGRWVYEYDDKDKERKRKAYEHRQKHEKRKREYRESGNGEKLKAGISALINGSPVGRFINETNKLIASTKKSNKKEPEDLGYRLDENGIATLTTASTEKKKKKK